MISRLISRFGGGCLQRCCAGRGRVVAQDAAEQAGQLRELGQDLRRDLVLVRHRGLGVVVRRPLPVRFSSTYEAF